MYNNFFLLWALSYRRHDVQQQENNQRQKHRPDTIKDILAEKANSIVNELLVEKGNCIVKELLVVGSR
jgi:hypothetical protein